MMLMILSKITDQLGRFSILAQPGTYYIKVSHPKYHFPAIKSYSQKNAYYGGKFSYNKASFVSLEIPMTKKDNAK